MGVFTNDGEAAALEYITNKDASPEDLVLRLFKNDLTPDSDSVVGDFTEADFTGYSAITLTGASWGAVSGTAPSQIAYAEQTFASTSDQTAQTIYGSYLTRSSTGDVVAAERFTASVDVQNNGDEIAVTPTLTATNAV